MQKKNGSGSQVTARSQFKIGIESLACDQMIQTFVILWQKTQPSVGSDHQVLVQMSFESLKNKNGEELQNHFHWCGLFFTRLENETIFIDDADFIQQDLKNNVGFHSIQNEPAKWPPASWRSLKNKRCNSFKSPMCRHCNKGFCQSGQLNNHKS